MIEAFSTIFKSKIVGNPTNVKFRKDGRRNKNDDPSNETLKIMDTESIPVKKHEMEIW